MDDYAGALSRALTAELQLREARDRIIRLETQLEALRQLHRPRQLDGHPGHVCLTCRHAPPWPCVTLRTFGITRVEDGPAL